MPKRKIIISIVLIFLFLIGSFVYFLFRIRIKEELSQIPSKEKTIEEKIIQELDRLRGGQEPFSEKEIKKQAEELQKLRWQSNAKFLSAEEIKKQIEELDKQRSQ